MGYVIYIIVAIIAYFFAMSQAPGPPAQPPPSLTDLSVPTAAPGRPIPVVYGTVLLQAPNVVWYGDLGYSPIKVKSGK